MNTTVVNIHHGHAYDVYIGRTGRGSDGYYGNPHPLDIKCPVCSVTNYQSVLPSKLVIHDRASALEAYRQYFLERVEKDLRFRERILGLHGKVLGCFCKPRACHGDVIVEWLENNIKM